MFRTEQLIHGSIDGYSKNLDPLEAILNTFSSANLAGAVCVHFELGEWYESITSQS